MTRRTVVAAVLGLATIGVLGGVGPALAQVNINIGTPPPTVIVAPPPPAPVIVEQRVPMYYYEGRYYRYYDRGWLIAERHEGPWFIVPVERVPRRVLLV